MVQRKVPTKLALQGDLVEKAEILFDVKNSRAASDLKKKMKKSGSTVFKRHVKQPGRPEAVAQPGLAHGKLVSSEKQSPVNKIVATPNYMKSTTSFEARKEKSYPQVSLTNPCSVRRRSSDNGKHVLDSGMKSAKTLARTSSLEKMRALTKNPSFKPVRASTRKSSPLVLCENLDVQRATCSSTLKDRKFPPYLGLNPGGTELEGTSAIKVCPYTYCSLNGHHHDPLPPLKNFLSARRRMIKTQRCITLICRSPRHPTSPSNDPSSVENLLMQDDVKSSSVAATEEENNGYFIEIYMKDEDYAGVDQRQVLEGSTICFGVEAEETSSQSEDAKEEEEVSPPLLVQEEGKERLLNDVPGESMWEVELSELNSEASDMEWGTGHLTPQHLDYSFECSSMTEMESNREAYNVEEELIYEELVIKQEVKGGSSDEVLEDEVSQESFDEEGFKPDEFSSSNDVEYDFLQVLNNIETSEPVDCTVQEPDPEEQTSVAKELSDEGHTINGENQNSSEETFETGSSADPVKEPHLEDAQLESSESENCNLSEAENPAKLQTENCSRAQVTTKCKNPIHDEDELALFNPRDPNFLPLEPDPEAEKVDLRHQELDERKNSEEWMVDYALRQVVTKLGPARKRKVSLLVEAFEKVMPITKFDLHSRHSSAFDHARPIQACS